MERTPTSPLACAGDGRCGVTAATSQRTTPLTTREAEAALARMRRGFGKWASKLQAKGVTDEEILALLEKPKRLEDGSLGWFTRTGRRDTCLPAAVASHSLPRLALAAACLRRVGR